LLYNALVNASDYSLKLLNHIMYSDRVAPTAIERLLYWCRAMIRYEARQGWVGADKASDEWVELRLRWAEYLRHVGAKLQP
jgi:hypothetical protein